MLPKDEKKPAINYTYPSERAYVDPPKSTNGDMKLFDSAKSGGDYGIKDPDVTQEIGGSKSENGNGAVE